MPSRAYRGPSYGLPLACAAVLQSIPVSCHFRGCKAPLSRIVSGAILSELAFPLRLRSNGFFHGADVIFPPNFAESVEQFFYMEFLLTDKFNN